MKAPKGAFIVYPLCYTINQHNARKHRNAVLRSHFFDYVPLWLTLCAPSHAGTHHYYYTDAQGNVFAKADAQGNIIATYDYAPYGTQAMGSAPNGPGYTGHVNDPETGLVYMQARYYDPAIGRFLSVDPVQPGNGNILNFNRYGYANNNPVNNIDPDGREVMSTNPKNNAKIAGYINSMALGTFRFDNNNRLVMISSKGDSSKFSTYYQTKLLQAMKSPATITINIAKNVQTKTLGTLDVQGWWRRYFRWKKRRHPSSHHFRRREHIVEGCFWRPSERWPR